MYTFQLGYFQAVSVIYYLNVENFLVSIIFGVNPLFTRLLSSVKILSLYVDLATYKRVVGVTFSNMVIASVSIILQ